MKARCAIHFLSSGDSFKSSLEAERAASLLSNQPHVLALVERVTDHGEVRRVWVRVGAIAYVEDLE